MGVHPIAYDTAYRFIVSRQADREEPNAQFDLVRSTASGIAVEQFLIKVDLSQVGDGHSVPLAITIEIDDVIVRETCVVR